MRKIHLLLLALLAVSGLSALLVGSAYAETTLLAEWLANGNPIVGASLPTESEGEIELEDSKTIAGAAVVLCSGILVGTVGENGADSITEILNLLRELIGKLGGLPLIGDGSANADCVRVSACAAGSTSSPIEVWPENLPWRTELFLMEDGKFLDLLVGSRYHLRCLVAGLAVEDACGEANEDTEFEIINDPEDAAIPAGALNAPGLRCALGGAGSGFDRADSLTLILLTSGELLSVSSE